MACDVMRARFCRHPCTVESTPHLINIRRIALLLSVRPFRLGKIRLLQSDRSME